MFRKLMFSGLICVLLAACPPPEGESRVMEINAVSVSPSFGFTGDEFTFAAQYESTTDARLTVELQDSVGNKLSDLQEVTLKAGKNKYAMKKVMEQPGIFKAVFSLASQGMVTVSKSEWFQIYAQGSPVPEFYWVSPENKIVSAGDSVVIDMKDVMVDSLNRLKLVSAVFMVEQQEETGTWIPAGNSVFGNLPELTSENLNNEQTLTVSDTACNGKYRLTLTIVNSATDETLSTAEKSVEFVVTVPGDPVADFVLTNTMPGYTQGDILYLDMSNIKTDSSENPVAGYKTAVFTLARTDNNTDYTDVSATEIFVSEFTPLTETNINEMYILTLKPNIESDGNYRLTLTVTNTADRQVSKSINLTVLAAGDIMRDGQRYTPVFVKKDFSSDAEVTNGFYEEIQLTAEGAVINFNSEQGRTDNQTTDLTIKNMNLGDSDTMKGWILEAKMNYSVGEGAASIWFNEGTNDKIRFFRRTDGRRFEYGADAAAESYAVVSGRDFSVGYQFNHEIKLGTSVFFYNGQKYSFVLNNTGQWCIENPAKLNNGNNNTFTFRIYVEAQETSTLRIKQVAVYQPKENN